MSVLKKKNQYHAYVSLLVSRKSDVVYNFKRKTLTIKLVVDTVLRSEV